MGKEALIDIQIGGSNKQFEIFVHEYEVAESHAWVTRVHVPVQLVAALVHGAVGEVEGVRRSGILPPVSYESN